MSKPRLLDLYCCAGGASYGYHLAGFDVVGVDIEPQPHYPFEFHQADALEFPLDGFDAIHASPPCQYATAYKRRGDWVYDSPNLIPPTRERLQAAGVPYVIENVPGARADLDHPIQLCGSSFGLDVQRHRLFEISVNELILAPPCNHGGQARRFPHAGNRNRARRSVEIGVWRIDLATQRAAIGIDWMNKPELSQAIPPAYTEWIGAWLLTHLTRQDSPAA